MIVTEAIQHTAQCIDLVDSIQAFTNDVNEFLTEATKLEAIFGSKDDRVVSITEENNHSELVNRAIEALRVELELRVVQLQFAAGGTT